MITRERSVDASRLPGEGFGVASPAWWGTVGFIVIEATSLILCATSYIYLSRRSPTWPPPGVPLPPLGMGSAVVIALILSLIPAWLLNRRAKAFDRNGVVMLLIIGAVVELVIVGLRALELHALPTRWDTSAYGSTVWFTLGLHTTLLIFDALETAGLLALFLWAPIEKKHFADVADAVLYWFFMVLIWIPLYFMLYITPRMH